MKPILIHFRNHFFFYTLAFFILVIGTISYYRIIIKQDYLVGYEGVCDPATEKCFIGCEDDECITEYYYSEVVKYAPDLYRECGKDITDCEKASVCLPNDRKCSITYCAVEVDGNTCETFTKEKKGESDNQEPAEKLLLQSNKMSNLNI